MPSCPRVPPITRSSGSRASALGRWRPPARRKSLLSRRRSTRPSSSPRRATTRARARARARMRARTRWRRVTRQARKRARRTRRKRPRGATARYRVQLLARDKRTRRCARPTPRYVASLAIEGSQSPRPSTCSWPPTSKPRLALKQGLAGCGCLRPSQVRRAGEGCLRSL